MARSGSILLRAVTLVLLYPALLLSAQSQEQQQEEQKTDQGPTTLFPHSDTSRWWISGQANVVFQAHPGFHAEYSGNSSCKQLRHERHNSSAGIGFKKNKSRRSPTLSDRGACTFVCESGGKSAPYRVQEEKRRLK